MTIERHFLENFKLSGNEMRKSKRVFVYTLGVHSLRLGWSSAVFRTSTESSTHADSTLLTAWLAQAAQFVANRSRMLRLFQT